METIREHELGTHAVELLDRLSHGEAFEIIKDGQTIGLMTPVQVGTPNKPTRTFNDWLLDSPRFGDLELPDRSRSVMRSVDL